MIRQKKQKDPICGTMVDSSQSPYKAEHHNKKYAFCSQQCLDKFKKNPKS
jgi:YHS domain-containing protein